MAITIDGDNGISGVNGTATTPALQGTDSNTGIVFGTDEVQIATGGSTRATVDSSGKLDVLSGDLRVTGGEGVSAALYLVADQGDDDGDSWRIISNQDANDLTISNDNSGSFSDLFTFTNAGHLGVGHGSPQFGITIGQDSGDIGKIGWEDGSNTKRASIFCNPSTDGLQFTTGSSDDLRLQILSNGRLEAYHVYTTAIGGSTRDVHIEDGGQLGYISSIRESKANISVLSDVDWIYQLQPSSFNYKLRDQDGEYTGEVSTELEYGLIAEDVEPIAPELCFYDEVEGEMELRGIHYKKLIVPLLKALQEANAKITTLETKVTALEAAE